MARLANFVLFLSLGMSSAFVAAPSKQFVPKASKIREAEISVSSLDLLDNYEINENQDISAKRKVNPCFHTSVGKIISNQNVSRL